MRFSRFLVFLSLFALVSSASAQDRQPLYNLDPETHVSAMSEMRVPVRIPVPDPDLEPQVVPLRCGFDGLITPGASLVVLGPDEDEKYKVMFSIWSGLAEGTTVTWYAIHLDGTREYVHQFTVTAGMAGGGFAGNMWGELTGGAPISGDVIGFRMEFTGALTTYSVNAPMPGPGRVPALVDVHPDGKLFLRVWMCPSPVVALWGRVHTVIGGWITPLPGYLIQGTPVVVCSGYPDSECLTQVVDIPVPQ